MAQTLQWVPATIKCISFLYFQIDKLKILCPYSMSTRKISKSSKPSHLNSNSCCPLILYPNQQISSNFLLHSEKSLEFIMPLDIPPRQYLCLLVPLPHALIMELLLPPYPYFASSYPRGPCMLPTLPTRIFTVRAKET